MARRRRRSNLSTVIGAVVLLILVAGYFFMEQPASEPTPTVTPTNGQTLTVKMLDVAQADAILIQTGDQTMLIDAGKNEGAADFVKTLQEMGVTKLDYLVGTHPHEDHIGGLDAVIDAFDVGILLMPNAQANTRTFEDVLDAMDRKGLKATTPHVGDTYTLGDASFIILAPNSTEYEDINNTSIMMRLTYGKRSFMLTGDAETVSEEEVLSLQKPLQSDVLKVGHHGSHSSTSPDFLEAVKPTIALISCATDNTYGHPHRETMDALKAANVAIYRTDLQGTVTVTTDGQTLEVTTEKG